jgi:hypothetical protein
LKPSSRNQLPHEPDCRSHAAAGNGLSPACCRQKWSVARISFSLSLACCHRHRLPLAPNPVCHLHAAVGNAVGCEQLLLHFCLITCVMVYSTLYHDTKEGINIIVYTMKQKAIYISIKTLIQSKLYHDIIRYTMPVTMVYTQVYTMEYTMV